MSTVFPSKYVAETVTVRWNFVDVFAFGETVTSSVVTVEVFTGIDSNPSDLLSGVTANSGTIVAQHLIRGFPGVIYTLICTVIGSTGAVYIKTSRQAVLSNLGSIYPSYSSLSLVGDLPDGSVGVPYFENLQIIGGIPPYSDLRLISGSMPLWLTANIIGSLVVYTGVPNALGTSIFTPEVSDYVGQRANNPQIISVGDAVNIVGDLPDGVLGDPIAFQYNIVGGTPPYGVSITAGTLPTGNNADIDNTGLVTGTYIGFGTYSWTVHVLDSLGLTADHPDSCIVGMLNWLVGGTDTLAQGCYLPSDGVTWMGPFAYTNMPYRLPRDFIVNGNTIVYLGTADGQTSLDGGATWTPCVGLTAASNQMGIFIEHSGVYLISTTGGNVKRSTDGINYTIIYTGDINASNVVEFGDTLTLAANYVLSRSADSGATWTPRVGWIISNVDPIYSIGTNGTLFMLCSSKNQIRTTSDGVNLGTITSPFVGILPIINCVESNGTWVIINTGGEVASSIDNGANWTVNVYVFPGLPIDMVASHGRFVIVGDGGILASADTSMVWTQSPTSFSTRRLFTIAVTVILP